MKSFIRIATKVVAACHFAFIIIVLIVTNGIELVQSAKAQQIDDMTPIFSSNTVGAMLQAAECISLRASKAEKASVITARKFEAALSQNERIELLQLDEKLLKYSDNDRKVLYRLLSKHCPATLGILNSIVRSSNLSNEALVAHQIQLESIITSYVVADILSLANRRKLFISDYTPIGLSESPF